MHGLNPIRPPVAGDGSTLDVQHIFPTLQGEGPYAGRPAVFVRLGGCNLACTFCDTEFESFTAQKVTDIVQKVAVLSEGVRKLVVITGGEPLRQPIEQLCEQLIAQGFKIQIETNGTLYCPLPAGVEIVCSPKNTGNGYFPVRPDLLARVNAFKFIVSAHDKKYNGVSEVGQANNIPVYVQPMDEYDDVKNAENVKLASELAQRHGYHLSLQIHKMLGIE